MNIQAINSAIVTGKFSIDDLDSIQDAVKFARSRIASTLVCTLTKGTKVRVNHVKVQGMVGTVLKVKIKKADVDFNGRIFQVPLSMCQVV
jgi:hypothetical protein